MNKEKLIEKIKRRKMKASASSPEIQNFIAGFNSGLKEAIKEIEES